MTETGIVQSTPGARLMLTRELLDQEKAQRQLLAEFIQSCMTVDVDYGQIEGRRERVLLKPGAQKLVDLFRCVATFRLDKEVEDWGAGVFSYRFKCQIHTRDGGLLLAEGFGSCNSRENKYHWREARRVCPGCGHREALMLAKDQSEWFCWAKRGGCGVTFPKDAPAIMGQTVGKVANDNPADLCNTLLKMAEKRALVDAAVNLARASDLFTQDLEDVLEGSTAATPAAPAASKATRDTERPPARPSSQGGQAKSPNPSEPRQQPARSSAPAGTPAPRPAPQAPPAQSAQQPAHALDFGKFRGRPLAEYSPEDLAEAYVMAGEAIRRAGGPTSPRAASFVKAKTSLEQEAKLRRLPLPRDNTPAPAHQPAA